MVQLSHPYMVTGKTIALTIWTFVSKVMSLLFNMLSRFIIDFFQRNKCLLISWLQSPSAVILDPKKINYMLNWMTGGQRNSEKAELRGSPRAFSGSWKIRTRRDSSCHFVWLLIQCWLVLYNHQDLDIPVSLAQFLSLMTYMDSADPGITMHREASVLNGLMLSKCIFNWNARFWAPGE